MDMLNRNGCDTSHTNHPRLTSGIGKRWLKENTNLLSPKVLFLLACSFLLLCYIGRISFVPGDVIRIPLLVLASLWTKMLLTGRINRCALYGSGLIHGYVLGILREDVAHSVCLEGLVIATWKVSSMVIGRPSKEEPRQVDPEVVDEDKLKRMWLSLIAQAVMNHVSPIRISLFDVGRVWPAIEMKGAPRLISGGKGGFEMDMKVDYKTDESTSIKAQIPMRVPGCGKIEVPILVSNPHIATDLLIECKIGERKEEDSEGQKYLAVSVQFDPIREFRVGQLEISIASNIHLLQYVPGIKKTLKSLIDRVSAPNIKRVVILNHSLQLLGYFELKRNQTWEIDQLLEQNNSFLKQDDFLYLEPEHALSLDQVPLDPTTPDHIDSQQLDPLEEDQTVHQLAPPDSNESVAEQTTPLSPPFTSDTPFSHLTSERTTDPWDYKPTSPGTKRNQAGVPYPSLHIR
ncbi:uncharacterized protein LOC126317476 [Schistocerca gregaria]|uniref:uncharacterized protein LOC126317476 n=1 Tax=Schistocerca gregaria TaxID=7010 RepID=UPI00211EB430|nr:uncharacterized protein LOC126317476 [Schistocerca gregaria]XP_049849102.1 uncharacterized protein LOC126317476 [Schistocerca gregaria]XP_049849103.1 uncharacterized protein LOC126317476 [Schistocerca gregaria]